MNDKELKRFEAKYTPEPNTGCWLWVASVKPDGYAKFDALRTGHRVAFEHWHGPVPAGKEVDHICGVRSCVNPAHLQAITHTENVAKSGAWAFNKGKTECPKGHPYAGGNLYVYGTNRQCLICRRARSLAFFKNKKNQMEASHR